jgi:hypothetical protein
MPPGGDPSQFELITTLEAGNYLQSLTFSPDGVWLGAITKDTKGTLIELWNLRRLSAGLKPFTEKGFELTL